MKIFFIYLGMLLGCGPVWGASGSIVQMTRRLRMSELEPIPAKDFFLDLGTRDGIREGDLVDVFRLVPVTNVATGNPQELIRIRIGQIKVMYVGETACMGRAQEIKDASQLPALDSPSFLIGDEVQLKSGLPFPGSVF